MKAMTKGLLTIALLAATTACDSAPTASSALVSEPGGPSFAAAEQGTLTFSASGSQTTSNPQTASGGAGSINFTGSVTTGTPCYNVTASHTGRRNTITVTVTATDNGNICTQVVTNQNYQGAVSGLAAGNYTFNVVHVVDGRSETAYTGSVAVQ